jgi:hypothetical protein
VPASAKREPNTLRKRVLALLLANLYASVCADELSGILQCHMDACVAAGFNGSQMGGRWV